MYFNSSPILLSDWIQWVRPIQKAQYIQDQFEIRDFHYYKTNITNNVQRTQMSAEKNEDEIDFNLIPEEIAYETY